MHNASPANVVSPWKSDGEWIDPILHDAAQRLGASRYTLAPGAQSASAAEREPIQLHAMSYRQFDHGRSIMYDDSQPEMVDDHGCFICRSEIIPVSCLVDSRDRRYLTLGICPTCGLLRHVRRPPESWYRSFYETQWDVTGRERLIEHPDQVQSVPFYVDQVQNFIPAGAKVLEIGAGWGGMMRAFAERGYQISGVEPSLHRAAFVRDKLGLDCHAIQAETIPVGESPFEPDSFDLIISSHALEHVYDTRQTLEHLRPLLKENGLAYIRLPFFYSDHPLILTHDITHGTSFAQANMIFMLQSIGFDVVRDWSDHTDVTLLVRKAPPLTEEQSRHKLAWLQTVQPQRGLADLLERSGLACIPEGWQQDMVVGAHWVAHFSNMPGPGTMVAMDYLIMGEDVRAVEELRRVVRERRPLQEVADLLPISFRYRSEGVSLWYY